LPPEKLEHSIEVVDVELDNLVSFYAGKNNTKINRDKKKLQKIDYPSVYEDSLNLSRSISRVLEDPASVILDEELARYAKYQKN